MAITTETGGAYRVYDEAGVLRFGAGDPETGTDFSATVRAPDDTSILDGVSDMFRIIASGLLASPLTPANSVASSTVNISTGLAYAPAFAAFAVVGTTDCYGLPNVIINPATGLTTRVLSASTTTAAGITTVEFQLQNGTGSSVAAGSFSMRFYLYEQIGV